MKLRDFYMHLMLDNKYYESLERYHLLEAGDNLTSYVRGFFDNNNWEIVKKGIWCYYTPINFDFKKQGWKIHISAILETIYDIIDIVVPILYENNIQFKHAIDEKMLRLINSKMWNRGATGKIITIYPKSDENFKYLIQILSKKLKKFKGPYILSDFRYKNSDIVFFRYGGFKNIQRLNVYGIKESLIRDGENNYILDERNPYPKIPKGISLPFENEKFYTWKNNNGNNKEILNNRYLVLKALSFSNSGGVYKAFDKRSKNEVVLKEARPFIDFSNGKDAIDRMKKEYIILKTLEKENITPKIYEIFQAWEHFFLVEEYIDGIELTYYPSIDNIILRSMYKSINKNKLIKEKNVFLKRLFGLFASFLNIISILHSYNIVFGDISPNNFIIVNNLEHYEEVKIIDFEGAFFKENQEGIPYSTPGFVSPQRMDKSIKSNFKDDYYSLGALLLNQIFPINPGLRLNVKLKNRFLNKYINKKYLPYILKVIINGLMEKKREDRLNKDQIIKMIKKSKELNIQIKKYFF